VSDTPPNPLEGLLSEFALGPAWARAKSEPVKQKFKESAEREFQPRRRDDRQGGGRGRDDRGERRQGGGDRREGNGERRQGGGGGQHRDDGRNSRGRPDFRSEEFAPAEGVTVTLVPDKHAIQLVCKEVQQVARVYPLFDIAQIILAERSRSRAVFEISEKHEPFLRCKIEEAIYLTKEEALRHLLAADWRDRYIEESTVEIDPPKGNFQSVAKCGISGVWLGPPNYHGYQTDIRRLHRELFSSMPFEAYSAKVRTERSEEAVNAWLDSMKTQTRWRILSDEESAGVPLSKAAPTEEPSDTFPEEIPAGVTEDQTDTGDPVSEKTEAPVAEETETQSPEETEVPAEVAAEAEAPAEEPAAQAPPEQEIKWFTDRAEFERALSAEVLEKVFHSTRKAKVSAGILGKSLSPGLLVRLKGAGNHARKHAAIMIPAICKILEAEHMPVFKRKGKLFTGPARPHALAADAVLAPRPAQMVTWIRENNPAKLEGLWNHVLPEGASAPPAEYAADLFWLLQQGHILLYTDDVLSVQEQPKPPEPKKPKQPKKKALVTAPAAEPEIKEANSSEPATRSTEENISSTESGSESIMRKAPSPELDTPPAGEEASSSESEAAPSEKKAPTPEPLPEIPEEKAAPEPMEILTEAVKDIVETVSETASKLIEAAFAASAPETPAPAPEDPKEKPETEPLP